MEDNGEIFPSGIRRVLGASQDFKSQLYYLWYDLGKNQLNQYLPHIEDVDNT